MRIRRNGLLALAPLLLAPSLAGAQADYTLTELLTLAERSSPSLAALAASSEAAQAHYLDARLLPAPEFEYTFGPGRSWDGTVERSTVGLRLSQAMEMPWTRSPRLASYRSARDAVRLDLEEERLELHFEVSSYYYRIIYLQDRVAVQQRNLENLERTAELVAVRARQGEVRELERLKLQVEAMRARTSLHDTMGELDGARAALDRRLGDALPEGFRLQGVLEAEPASLDSLELQDRMRAGRPALLRSALAVEQARQELAAERGGRLLPSEYLLTAFHEEGLHGRVTGLAVHVPLPFLWDARTRRIRQGLAEVTRREQEQRALELELAGAVNDQIRRLRLAGERLTLFREGLLDQADTSLRIAQTTYDAGELSLIDYLDARRTRESIMSDYQASLLEWNVERAALERAIGGR
jgi:outer membrane protein TolC